MSDGFDPERFRPAVRESVDFFDEVVVKRRGQDAPAYFPGGPSDLTGAFGINLFEQHAHLAGLLDPRKRPGETDAAWLDRMTAETVAVLERLPYVERLSKSHWRVRECFSPTSKS